VGADLALNWHVQTWQDAGNGDNEPHVDEAMVSWTDFDVGFARVVEMTAAKMMVFFLGHAICFYPQPWA